MSSLFSGEYRIYARDLFFFLLTCSISVFVAEYFIFTDSSRMTHRPKSSFSERWTREVQKSS